VRSVALIVVAVERVPISALHRRNTADTDEGTIKSIDR